MPFGDISPNFDQQVDKIVNDLNQIYVSAVTTPSSVQRVWMMPEHENPVSPPGTWDGGVFSITGSDSIAFAYDRSDLNNNYSQAIDTSGQSGGGRVVDRWLCKTQVDYLASMERSWRARHMSSIRGSAHALARIGGQGNNTATVFHAVRAYLSDVLTAGYSDAQVTEGNVETS